MKPKILSEADLFFGSLRGRRMGAPYFTPSDDHLKRPCRIHAQRTVDAGLARQALAPDCG